MFALTTATLQLKKYGRFAAIERAAAVAELDVEAGDHAHIAGLRRARAAHFLARLRMKAAAPAHRGYRRVEHGLRRKNMCAIEH